MRKATIERKTNETQIKVVLNLDGKGKSKVKTPIAFLNHLLESFAKHGVFDLNITAKGDMEVDQHHTVEDVGLVLGEAFKKALGNKKGINRAGYFVFPMDDALSVVSVDIGGRPYLNLDVKFNNQKTGDLDTELIEDFFGAFTFKAETNVHVRLLYGRNDHHKLESIFKAFGKAMMMACSKDKRLKSIPSTKGKL